jgi:hypothetical protein
MPVYTVTIVHTLRVVGTITLTARNEDAAQSRAEQMVEQGKFGTLTWNITGADHRIDEWNEDEANVVIEEVQEG